MDIEEKVAEKVFRVAVRAAQSKPINELQVANEILNLVRDEGVMPGPEPDTARADGTAPVVPEDFYRREAERLKVQMMKSVEAAKMWEARCHDAATALERSHKEAEELRRSLSLIGEIVTKEGARANERAVYRNYDAERHGSKKQIIQEGDYVRITDGVGRGQVVKVEEVVQLPMGAGLAVMLDHGEREILNPANVEMA